MFEKDRGRFARIEQDGVFKWQAGAAIGANAAA